MFCHKSHPGREDYSQAGTVGYIIDSTDFMFQCMGCPVFLTPYPTSCLLYTSESSALSVSSNACESSSTYMLWFLRTICLFKKEVERTSIDAIG